MAENQNKNKNLLPAAIIVAAIIIAGALIVSTKIYVDGNIKKEKAPAGPSVEGQPILGSLQAKVTIIEFSDFQCPFCARYTLDTFPQIKQEYVDTGKVKIVFKNFPLSFHENAKIAAEAGECTFEQNKFWEYEQKLFENQNALSENDLKKYARDLGLQAEQFNNCLDSEKYVKEVQNDFKEGQEAGVSGTPTFFINGEKLVGAYPFSEFQKIIEEKLK